MLYTYKYYFSGISQADHWSVLIGQMVLFITFTSTAKMGGV